ncbi:2-C-methyl-D-erythritol 4-phosphate cytidylyltransferase [Microbacterium sp. cf332]|uniref:2-C-methyl-D-erythritol 4-phosphate cytidylyltransferase n=1 Tax=Microbacterium sp. cf332 TaxID=1761804 RepID=UPI00088E6FE5|nr:2-C-methyl-D-erythritol 4-phosphate cytidylyltransferase [Microbacterium sp. cf332]SDQ87127.1 2-C-methyl-D-erythritol 2,4-cyclodiphosphate synthase [Microbacterium sp. cf332]
MGIIPVPRVAVVVVAAGSGTRLSAGAPKAFVGIDDRSVLRHALDGVARAPLAQVVVVVPAGREGDARTEADAAFGDRSELVTVVVGGDTRQRSVAAGLRALWADVETVLIHDAARALTPPAVFERVIAEVERTGAGVVPARPVVDTLKRVAGADVEAAVDRAPLVAAQTPQGFPRALLDRAYADATADYTDDTALVAASGHPIRTVDGDDLSFKITTPADLERARHLLRPIAPAASALPLVGIGTDVHAFGGDGPLRLAGLEWPRETGLRGHSDGDAVAHAIVDAVLAAAGLGDIGTHFGVDRPEYAGAAGIVFLQRVRQLVAEAGLAIGNVSVQVQANRPRFAPRRAEAEGVLTAALGAPVSVAATTTDGLGFTGAGEGVSATAVALVYRIR